MKVGNAFGWFFFRFFFSFSIKIAFPCSFTSWFDSHFCGRTVAQLIPSVLEINVWHTHTHTHVRRTNQIGKMSFDFFLLILWIMCKNVLWFGGRFNNAQQLNRKESNVVEKGLLSFERLVFNYQHPFSCSPINSFLSEIIWSLSFFYSFFLCEKFFTISFQQTRFSSFQYEYMEHATLTAPSAHTNMDTDAHTPSKSSRPQWNVPVPCSKSIPK